MTVVTLLVGTTLVLAWQFASPRRGVRQLVAPAGNAAPLLARAPAASTRQTAEFAAMMPQLPCADVDAAQKFYERQLGFTLVSRDATRGEVVLRHDDEMLALVPKAPPFDGPVSFYALVQHVGAYQRELEARGVKLESMPPSSTVSPGSERFSVTDPDGNRIIFVEEPTIKR